MRHLPVCLSLMILCLLVSTAHATERVTATSVPVYQKLNSRFPSGEYSRIWLEDHLESTLAQKWFEVSTPAGQRGWVAEDYLLSPLQLTDQAIVVDEVPLRYRPALDALSTGPHLQKGMLTLILEIQNSWARVQPLPASEFRETWVPTEMIKASPSFFGSRAFVHTSTLLSIMPGKNSRVSGEVPAQSLVVVSADSDAKPLPNGWLEIRFHSSIGYIQRDKVWLIKDLEDSTMRTSMAEVPLMAEPSPSAKQLAKVDLKTPLHSFGSRTIRWGQARVAGLGAMWWPLGNDDAVPKTAMISKDDQLNSESLFHRKIFDMAASPDIPSLKLLSADGIFRTLDNETWTKIPDFKNENHPLAITKSGTIFVGPFRSVDHGDTFEQWIRWDRLVLAVAPRRASAPPKLRIAEIHPEDEEARHITVHLITGDHKQIRVHTDDGGQRWIKL